MKNLIKVGAFMGLCLICSINAMAQNLVANPSFEEFVESEQSVPLPWPFDYTNPNYVPTNWSQYASCDFYIESADEPPNRAKEGTNFVRFAAYSSNGQIYREFPTGITTAPLIAGELYEVEFWARNAEFNNVDAQAVGLVQYQLGAHLSTSPVPCDYPDNCIFSYVPAFEDYVLPSTTGWQRISGFFVPESDGVHYITIGNFIPSGNIGFDGNVSILVYVDEVSVVGCTSDQSLNPQPDIVLPANACIYTQLIADLSASVDVESYRYQLCDDNGTALNGFSPWIAGTPTAIDVNAIADPFLEKGNCYQLKVEAQGGCTIAETSTVFCIDDDSFSMQAVNSPACEGELVSLSADHHDDWTYYWGTLGDPGLYGNGVGLSTIEVPADLNVTTYMVTIETLAGCESVQISNEIIVHPSDNTPPSTTGVNGTNSFVAYIQADHNLCFSIPTSDNPEEAVTFAGSNNLPTGSSLTDNNAFQETGTFCWTPSDDDIGFHSFEIILEDQNSCGSVQSTFTFELKVLCSYCPAEVYYENRQPAPDGIPLPPETIAGYKIVAGEDVDDTQNNGPVITGTDLITFRAPTIILMEAGFTGGPGFTAIIDPNSCIDECEDCCDDWGGFTYDQIPNVFTPNGDGVNDYWYVPDVDHPFCAYGAQEYELIIFNRWGTPVYTIEEANGINTCCPFEAPAPEHNIPHASIYWDGITNNNAPSNDGVYYYVVTLRSCGQSVSEAGSITMFDGPGLVNNGNKWSTQKSQSGDLDKEIDQETRRVLQREMEKTVDPFIYPNPFFDQVQVSWGSYVEGSEMKIYSMDGKLVSTLRSQSYTDVVNLEMLPTGTYVAKISNGEHSFEQVIIKK